MGAKKTIELPGLHFGGLQAYHGMVQHCRSRAERADICANAARLDSGYKDALLASGISCERDTDYGDNDWSGCELSFDHSLFLLSTVMSTPSSDRVVLDAGLKSTSAECGR